MARIAITLSDTDAKRIQGKLGALGQAVQAQVVNRAINRAMDSVKAEAKRRVRSELPGLAVASISKRLLVKSSSISSLFADLDVDYEPVPLIAFSAKRTAHGVSVRVKKRTILRAFIQKPPKGGLGVFGRTGAPQPRQRRRRGVSGPVRPREPIKFLYGPTVLGVLLKHVDAVKELGGEKLLKELEHEIDFALSKGGTFGGSK